MGKIKKLFVRVICIVLILSILPTATVFAGTNFDDDIEGFPWEFTDMDVAYVQNFNESNIIAPDCTGFTLNIPARTRTARVIANGIAAPDSEIVIFDNGVEVGITRALANGNWSLVFNLARTFALSTHLIYAEMLTPQGERIRSDSKLLIHDASYVEVSKVTMLYRNQVVVFDFLNPPSTPPSFTYIYPTPFTFIVEFTDHDPSLMYAVNVIVQTQVGTVY